MRQTHPERHTALARRGSLTLEFAALVVPLLMLVLGSMEVGYDFFVQAALDNAVHVAARGVQVGTAQGSVSGAALTKWVASAVCPALGGLLDCGQLYVSVIAIPSGTGQNYYSYITNNPPSVATLMSPSDSVCTGSGGQLMLLRAYYLSPTYLGLLVPAWSQVSPLNNGARIHVTYAETGFVNEYFAGGEAGC